MVEVIGALDPLISLAVILMVTYGGALPVPGVQTNEQLVIVISLLVKLADDEAT